MAPVERMESSAWCLFACLPNPCSASTTILLPPRRRRRTDGVSRRRCARICSGHGNPWRLPSTRRRGLTGGDRVRPRRLLPGGRGARYSGHGRSNREHAASCHCQPGPLESGCLVVASAQPARRGGAERRESTRRMCAWGVGTSARQDLRGRVNKWHQLDQLRPADAASLRWPPSLADQAIAPDRTRRYVP